MAKKKTLPKLKAKAQEVVNKYIRLRDEGKPCISCGEIKPLQAGHYFSVKTHDGLRYHADNIQGECIYCNCFNESHLIGYGINLRSRIGEERYNELLHAAQNYKQFGYKFSRSELEEIIATYQQKINELL